MCLSVSLFWSLQHLFIHVFDHLFDSSCFLNSIINHSILFFGSGPNAHISAAQIANNVHIGANAVLQPFSIVKDHVKILPHTVVPAGMVVASGSVVAGRPGRVVGEVPDGWGVSMGGGGGGLGGGGGGGVVGSGSNANEYGGDSTWVEGGELMDLVRSIR